MNIAELLATLSKHRGVVALCSAIILNFVGQGSMSPVLPLFTESLGAGATLIGLVVVMFTVGRLLMSLPGGILTQRLGRKPLLVAGVTLAGVGTLLAAFSQDAGQLLGFRLLSGLGNGTFLVAAIVYLKDISTTETRARYQSLNELSIVFGLSVGSVIGGLLADAVSLRAPFFLQAAMTAMAVPVILLFIPETKRLVDSQEAAAPPVATGAGSSRKLMQGLLLNPGFLVVALFTLWIVATRWGGRFVIMPIFAEGKGFSPGDLGVFFFFTHVPQFFAVILAGYLADRYGRKMAIAPAAVLYSLGIALFIFTESYWMLLLSGVIMGIGEGLTGPPMAAYFVDMAPRGLEGFTLGLYGTFGGGGALIGAVLLGSIADATSFESALWVDVIILMTLAMALLIIAGETSTKRLRQRPQET